MKKLLLAGISALAITSASAFAQDNSSNVNQTGTGAVATVTQDGANDVSAITQTGGGTVTVHQTGVNGSTSTVNTSADDRPPESTVTVTQSDTGGAAAPIGQSNVSTVVQDNVNGFGLTGTGSTVDVTQVHNAPGAGQNSSYVQQGRNAVSGQVTVNQTGGENLSYYSSTTSTDNDAVINQTGVGNNSVVLQDFQGGAALATVTQNNAGGPVNSAFIDQVSDGFSASPPEFAFGAEAHITQDGSGNSSSIVQTGYSDMMSLGNYAENDQTGDGHSSAITQGGIDNFASVSQSGLGNWSSVDQGGNANSAIVNQSSNNNVSSVSQGGNNNAATVTQGM